MGSILTNGVFLPAEGERNCYEGLAANWTALDRLIGGYNAHIGNATIHVTAEDKTKWDAVTSKADASALTAHTGDTTIHVTAEDKQAWNGKADASALTAHTGNTTIHVTATDKAKWDAVTSKADDSDVVHKSGNETVGGKKTFSDTATFVSVNIEDIRWKSLANQTVDLNDCYIPRAGAISGYYTTDISSGANISNKAINTAFTMISLTTRRVSASDYQVRQVFYGSGAKYIRTCSNGTWTAWVNETDKFVTTDTAQTISGNKTFSEDIVISNSDISQNSKRLVIRSSKVNLGDSNSDSWGISFNAGASYAALINSEKSPNSMQGLSFSVRTKDGNNNLISASYRLRIYTDGSAILIPNETDSISLGSSSNKWKDVQTNQINGLNPGALSLPSSAYVDISAYVTNLSGGSNQYVAPDSGIVAVDISSTNGYVLYNNNLGIGDRLSGSNFRRAAIIPVRKNDTVIIQSDGGTLNYAKFYPCQGNV